jgi:hypothetical protein
MFHLPAHKDTANPAGQVTNEPAKTVLTHYVDVIVRQINLTTGTAKGAKRQVIERTWFPTGDEAHLFYKWAAHRCGPGYVSVPCYPQESHRLVVMGGPKPPYGEDW